MKFRVGDRVRILSMTSAWFGCTGVVMEVASKLRLPAKRWPETLKYRIRISGLGGFNHMPLWCAEDELALEMELE